MTATDLNTVREALEFAASMLTGDRGTFGSALAALDRIEAELSELHEWVDRMPAAYVYPDRSPLWKNWAIGVPKENT